MSVRLYNCLKKNGINTLGDIVNTPYEKFLKMRGLGKTSLEELEMIVLKYGYDLKTGKKIK